MAQQNRRITLAQRPNGWPTADCFKLETLPVPEAADGQCVVESIYLSVDPYMRGRMSAGKSYAPPVEIGEVMVGGAVGRVVQSRADGFKEGDIVVGDLGWQEYAVAAGGELRKVDTSLGPISTALGVLGMPGLTAYFGFIDLGDPHAGETVVVSGAAGAVGSVVGQIATLRGCRAVGIAGSDEKVAHITEDLGFEAGLNYKTAESLGSGLEELCPAGIDIYFDNVGGAITDAVFPLLNTQSRVTVCGQISQYNLEQPEMGPRLLWHLIVKRIKMQGFLVFDFADRFPHALPQLAHWVKSGQILYRERIGEGIENAPAAFIEMLQGKNIGKQLVKLRDE